MPNNSTQNNQLFGKSEQVSEPRPFISCWTEVIRQSYSRPLVGGGTFRGERPVAAVNHCSDGTKQYFGSDHEEITEKEFNTIKEALSNPTTLDTVKEDV